MFRAFHKNKAQSMLEYVSLIVVISIALMAMTRYIRRSVNARLKQVQEELDEAKR